MTPARQTFRPGKVVPYLFHAEETWLELFSPSESELEEEIEYCLAEVRRSGKLTQPDF